MKLDLTRLPVGEMVVGFLIVSLLATFILAFTLVDSGSDEIEDVVADATSTAVLGDVAISMGDNFFASDEITVAAGDTVTFDLTNDGAAVHNMRIAQPDGNYSNNGVCALDGADPCSDPAAVTSGETAVLEWDVSGESGAVIPFRCDFHPVEMTGILTVQ
jgi:plastocyanin